MVKFLTLQVRSRKKNIYRGKAQLNKPVGEDFKLGENQFTKNDTVTLTSIDNKKLDVENEIRKARKTKKAQINLAQKYNSANPIQQGDVFEDILKYSGTLTGDSNTYGGKKPLDGVYKGRLAELKRTAKSKNVIRDKRLRHEFQESKLRQQSLTSYKDDIQLSGVTQLSPMQKRVDIQKFANGGQVRADELRMGDMLSSGETVEQKLRVGNRQRRQIQLMLAKGGQSRREKVDLNKMFDVKTRGQDMALKLASGGVVQKLAEGGSPQARKNAYIFDFDDTLATTEAKSFKDFSNPDFIESAAATRYASLAKRRASQGDDVHVLTARSGSKQIRGAIASFMAKNGIPTKSIMGVGRAFPNEREPGKRPGTTRKLSTASKKQRVLQNLAKRYGQITFLDDNIENILKASEVKNVQAVAATKEKLFKKFADGGGAAKGSTSKTKMYTLEQAHAAGLNRAALSRGFGKTTVDAFFGGTAAETQAASRKSESQARKRKGATDSNLTYGAAFLEKVTASTSGERSVDVDGKKVLYDLKTAYVDAADASKN